MPNWQEIFREKGRVFRKPQEDMKEVIRFLKKEKARKILDLGCGTGRHTVMLAKAGFRVCSMDIADEGLRQTRRWLNDNGLRAKVKKASIYKILPFKDRSFDAVISTQVIHHNRRPKIQACISEIERVLKPGGIVFITVASGGRKRRRDSRGGTSKIRFIARNTYVPIDGDEAGLVHYIYKRKTLLEDFRHFEMLDLHKSAKKSHLCMLARLRS